MLVGLGGFIAGYHELVHDDYRSYGYNGYGYGYSGYGSYRDGFRDGRAYERQREDAPAGYYDYYGRRG